MSEKLALIIGNSEFDDRNLVQLVTPDADVKALAGVLRDPDIGGFKDVVALVNQPAATIRRAIAAFFSGRGRDDLLLLYFSGHGIRDDRGQLFLAVKDTEYSLLRGTAIPASYITDEMDNSSSRRQVLILDCCHSGAFARGMKGTPGASVGTAVAFEGTGSGRVVLTATDSTQYAWEGDQLIGQAENSVFTQHLIEGLRSGEPDIDADGQITLDELYNYVYGKVIKETPRQTPGKWSYGQQGEIVIARNLHPVVKPVELPIDIQQTIDDPRPWVREGAVNELDRIAQGSNPGLALAAQEALKRMAEDDSRRVAAAAMLALGSEEGVHKGVIEELKTGEGLQVEPEKPAVHMAEKESFEDQKAESKLDLKVDENLVEQESTNLETNPADSAQQIPFTLEKGKSIPMIGAGWGIGALIGSTIEAFIFTYLIFTDLMLESDLWLYRIFFGWIITAAIGGLTIGLVLWRRELSSHWKPILLMTAGWVVSRLLVAVYYLYSDLSYLFYNNAVNNIQNEILLSGIYGAITGAFIGAFGGLITALVMFHSELINGWKQIGLITIGWVLGWTIGYGFFGYIISPGQSRNAVLIVIGVTICGIICGLIGGAVMVSQIDGARHRK